MSIVVVICRIRRPAQRSHRAECRLKTLPLLPWRWYSHGSSSSRFPLPTPKAPMDKLLPPPPSNEPCPSGAPFKLLFFFLPACSNLLSISCRGCFSSIASNLAGWKRLRLISGVSIFFQGVRCNVYLRWQSKS